MATFAIAFEDINVAADILSEIFPHQHDAHVVERRVALRNRAAAQAADNVTRWVKSGAFGRGVSIEQFLRDEAA